MHYALYYYCWFCVVKGPKPGSGSARYPSFFWAWARNFEKGPSSTQAWSWLFEKGLENLSFYEVKRRGLSSLGLDFVWRAWAWTRLELDFQGSGLARAWSFRLNPSLILCNKCNMQGCQKVLRISSPFLVWAGIWTSTYFQGIICFPNLVSGMDFELQNLHG